MPVTNPNARGRPSKYDKTIPAKVRKYTESCKDFRREDGGLEVNNPSVWGLARALKVSKATLTNWANEYPDFFDAYEDMKNTQAERLWNGGLSGDLKSPVVLRGLGSNHGMVEKTEQKIDMALSIDDMISEFDEE